MKISVIQKGKVIIQDVPQIKLDGRTGAILKVLGCGLCGSDIVKLRENISPEGSVLGHEIVAQIVEINSDTNFKIDDKIVTSHHIPCGKCYYCKCGNVSMCEHFKKTNIKPGGFSEYVYVSEEHLENVAYLVPEGLSDMEVSFYEPLGCCVRAVKRARLSQNSKVLVVGLGSIGILMAQVLKAYDMDVTGCDLISERVEFIKSLGINGCLVKNLPDTLNADAVFMTSGADKAIDTALRSIRSGGTILVFSSTPLNLGYANNEIYYRELTVLGSYSPAPADLKESLDLLSSKKVNVKNISTVYEMHEIQKAIEDTVSNKILKAYIKISGEG